MRSLVEKRWKRYADRVAGGEITAGNYGGKLGKHHFHLHALLSEASA